jgi:hypothetical protein
MLDVFAGQVRAAATEAGFPAVKLPGHAIAAGERAWEGFLHDADWTALENALTTLVRRHTR